MYHNVEGFLVRYQGVECHQTRSSAQLPVGPFKALISGARLFARFFDNECATTPFFQVKFVTDERTISWKLYKRPI